MRPFEHNPWPQDIVVILSSMWADGKSQQVIADRLGISKSAVGGKIHRLDLPRRPNPAGKGRSHQKKLPAGAVRNHHTAPDDPEAKPMLAKDRRPPEAPTERPGVDLPRLFPRMTECAWLMNSAKPWRSCGEPTAPGKPYCAKHCLDAKGKHVAPVKAP